MAGKRIPGKYESHSGVTTKALRLTFTDMRAVSGGPTTLHLYVDELDADTRYNLARSLVDWATRVEGEALGEIHKASQLALFEEHTAELNRFAPPDA